MSATKYLIMGQCGFFACIVVSILIQPLGLTANHGISYYGAHKATIIPFGLGFLIAALFFLRAAVLLPKTEFFRVASTGLMVIAILMTGVALTPITFGTFVRTAHLTFGLSLFTVEMLLGLWFSCVVTRSRFDLFVVAIQAAACLLSFASLLEFLRLEIQGQLLFQLAFSVLIDRVIAAKLNQNAAS